jgi:hypothetical protein
MAALRGDISFRYLKQFFLVLIDKNKLLRHLICLFTLIINIYGLGVGISTIIKFTSGRGWGMTPRGLSYKAFNLPSHPDASIIYFCPLKLDDILNSLYIT